MRLGCCVTFNSFMPETASDESGSGLTPDDRCSLLKGTLNHIKEAGYDFAELTVGTVAGDVTENEYSMIKGVVSEVGLPIVAFNCFIPGSIRVAGPEADPEVTKEYVEKALYRVGDLGANVVVFGSGKARTIPEGYSCEEGMRQIEEFLAMASAVAEENGVKVAIEHLNRGESNVITSLADAVELADRLSISGLGVLADYYHMHKEGEDLSVLPLASQRLVHAHVADTDRRYPGSRGADIPGFVRALRSGGYDSTLSVECQFSNFASEAAKAAEYLRGLLEALEL